MTVFKEIFRRYKAGGKCAYAPWNAIGEGAPLPYPELRLWPPPPEKVQKSPISDWMDRRFCISERYFVTTVAPGESNFESFQFFGDSANPHDLAKFPNCGFLEVRIGAIGAQPLVMFKFRRWHKWVCASKSQSSTTLLRGNTNFLFKNWVVLALNLVFINGFVLWGNEIGPNGPI